MEESDAWTSQSKELMLTTGSPLWRSKATTRISRQKDKAAGVHHGLLGNPYRSWDYLRWGNIQPIERESKIVAAKIIVYAGESEAVFLLYANQWTSVGGCYLLETNIYNVHT